MARVSTYLNFDGNAEEALEFYRKAFGTDYTSPVMHMGDVPADPNGPTVSEAEKRLVMHAELPILAGARAHGDRHRRVHGPAVEDR